MKYIQHMTFCHKDPKIVNLIGEFGPHGYAAFWLVLEQVGGNFCAKKQENFLKLPTKFWQNFTHFSPKKFKNFLEFCKKNELFDYVSEGKSTTIIFPNLLKYWDDYVKKATRKQAKMSGHTPDKCRSSYNSNSNSNSNSNFPYQSKGKYITSLKGGEGAASAQPDEFDPPEFDPPTHDSQDHDFLGPDFYEQDFHEQDFH